MLSGRLPSGSKNRRPAANVRIVDHSGRPDGAKQTTIDGQGSGLAQT